MLYSDGPTRVAFYLRVSTARQAQYDVSLPDQQRECEIYCILRKYEIAEIFIEQGASATNDRRPEFRRMIAAATQSPRPFEVIAVHSFSRFFRDHFELEYYVRKLERNGVKLVSVTQEIGDDPMHVMMRQVITLFDEYQSKENSKHVSRALRENARQGFWCGSTPPFGYRVVEVERRGDQIKKKLVIDDRCEHFVRLVYRLALSGPDGRKPFGLKRIANYLHERGHRTPSGALWATGQLHRMLTRRTYIGEHPYAQRAKDGSLNPRSEVVVVAVPAIISPEDFEAVQSLLRSRRFNIQPNTLGPSPMLKGFIYCSECGARLGVKNAERGRYRYYTCSRRGRYGPAGCSGVSMRLEALEGKIKNYLTKRLLVPERLVKLFRPITDSQRRIFEDAQMELHSLQQVELRSGERLKAVYDANENGRVKLGEATIAHQLEELTEIHARHRAVADDARRKLKRLAKTVVPPQIIERATGEARTSIKLGTPALKRMLRTSFERIEVSSRQIRLIGSKPRLLQAVIQAGHEDDTDDADWQSMRANDEDRYVMSIRLE
ncbi:recombinase family protein [Sphingopyxis terrae]|uniref:Site-specific DNA recombinase n=1 Tax=Sphingopyxis terrae subsp. ummariensis TaxID=429001 RepID=A0A1Y6FNP4_9SPHN|nr:recombinase family protein [Sphingopyxis terrae]PCF91394.1 recombinase family protein [Sphingopyxis terrae subsp. ummariensis]SMQ76578.1 Site-specific DNA recombinase [Sphingopyxis terrae subsp. ummariensis]